MARAKKDTEAGKLATAKWNATMLAKLGEAGYKEHFRRMGQKGGRKRVRKGFASNPALASIAGRKGGRISSRKGVSNGQGKTSKPRTLHIPVMVVE